MMKRSRLLLPAPVLLALLLLPACSSSPSGDLVSTASPSSSPSVSLSSSTEPTDSPTGTWERIGIVTAGTVEQDPTVKEIQEFLDQALNGGTLTTTEPGEEVSPKYTASSDGKNYLAVTRSKDGDFYATGNGEQWCSVRLPPGTTPTVSDWECSPGRPDGGNEFEIIAGYAWLAKTPSQQFLYGYNDSEGLFERNGDIIRLTVSSLVNKGDSTIIVYDLTGGTITQTWISTAFPTEETVLTYSPDLPAEWPEMPPLPTSSDGSPRETNLP